MSGEGEDRKDGRLKEGVFLSAPESLKEWNNCIWEQQTGPILLGEQAALRAVPGLASTLNLNFEQHTTPHQQWQAAGQGLITFAWLLDVRYGSPL